jgi:hypothetical protein
VNTLNAHCEKAVPFCFTIDSAIVDDLIVGMLCGEDEDERGRSSVIPSFFEKGCEGRVYNVTVRKAKQFVLCKRIVAAGVSFHATSRIMCDVADVTGASQVSVGNSDLKVADYIRSTVAFVLQTISDVLCSCWSFSVAFDVATAHTTSYFDIRVRAYFTGEIQNLYVIAIPMYESHTGEYMFQIFKRIFNVLELSWARKLVGATTDGASNMTGSHRGAVIFIERAFFPGFYRAWCGLPQLDLVVQHAVSTLL